MNQPLLSPDNPLVKRWRSLHDTRGRREAGAFLVEGRRAIDGFLAAGWRPEVILVRLGEELPGTWPEDAAQPVSARVAERLSQASTASGYLGVFPIPVPPPLDLQAGGLVLAEVGDPGNAGTLLRSAAAFGVRQVVLLGGVEPWGAKTVQASAGALALLHVHQLADTFGLAPLAGGAPCCALVVSGGSAPAALCAGPRWLVVGSEAHGLRPEWLVACSERLTLPMPGPVESLNAAVAGSLACYLLAMRGTEQGPVVR